MTLIEKELDRLLRLRQGGQYSRFECRFGVQTPDACCQILGSGEEEAAVARPLYTRNSIVMSNILPMAHKRREL